MIDALTTVFFILVLVAVALCLNLHSIIKGKDREDDR